LSQLSRHPKSGLLQTELARDLDVGKVSVGGLIDRLEAGGYVTRQPDKSDRRAKRIQMTEKGREVLRQMVKVGHELNQLILAGLPETEVATTEHALTVMKDNIRAAVTDMNEVELPVGVYAPESRPTVRRPEPRLQSDAPQRVARTRR
jgi:DNA-binding MarR family transcriptional regulator